jgi:hypothetical protein
MSRMQFKVARQLIVEEKQYDAARVLLRGIDHPMARDWLAKLDKIDPPPVSVIAPRRRSVIRYTNLDIAITIGLIILAFAVLVHVNRPQSQATASVPVETTTEYSEPYVVNTIPPPTQNYYSSGRTACGDGWVSHSSGRGTCSHHKGVKK